MKNKINELHMLVLLIGQSQQILERLKVRRAKEKSEIEIARIDALMAVFKIPKKFMRFKKLRREITIRRHACRAEFHKHAI